MAQTKFPLVGSFGGDVVHQTHVFRSNGVSQHPLQRAGLAAPQVLPAVGAGTVPGVLGGGAPAAAHSLVSPPTMFIGLVGNNRIGS